MKNSKPALWVCVFLASLFFSCHEAEMHAPVTSSMKNQPLYAVVSTVSELLSALDRIQDMEGGTIMLKPGLYQLKEPLQLQNKYKVVIAGSGWNTILEQRGAGDAIQMTNSHFCVVKDLLIECKTPGMSGSGMVFRDSSSCVVSYCRISNFPESGIVFLGNPQAPMSSNTVRDCHFIGNRGAQLRSFHNNDFYILGNQFGVPGLPYKDRPRTGCHLDHSSAGTYSMNYHWGNVVALQLGSGAHFNRIENNRFEESSENGILIGTRGGGDPCVENIIVGNTIHTNSEFNIGKFPAVEAWNAVDVIFSQNQIFSWDTESTRHKSGLFLGRGCRSWIVTDNIFRHHTDKAIDADPTAGHMIERNLSD